MPARARKVYVITEDASQTGLEFERPSWWDIERLFEIYADRKIFFPDGQEILLVEWPHLLDFDLQAGIRVWSLPEQDPGLVDIESQKRDLLARVQDVHWFVVGKKRVWMVPEAARPGCDIFQEPPWWTFATFDAQFKEWYVHFHKKYSDRFLEESNPLWLDYVALFTGAEILSLNEKSLEAYRRWKRKLGEDITPYDRKTMGKVRRALQNAVWVVIYDYEWESGLD